MNTQVVTQVEILALMMLVGVILRKLQIATDAFKKGMADLLINFAMPMMIVASFNFTPDPSLVRNAWLVLAASFAIHIALIVLSAVFYFRFQGERKRIFSFATVFSNCGFVGLPVVQGLYGDVGVFYASIFSIPFNLLIWSYGISLFSGERDLRGMCRNVANMPLLSALFGLLLLTFSIKLPLPVLKTCEGIGGMTTPLSMFIIGSMLADVKLRDIFSGLDVYYMSVIRLIVVPVLCMLVLRALGADPLMVNVCVVLVAMPAASIIGVFADRYDSDRATASRCAFLTTILSLLTLPGVLARV